MSDEILIKAEHVSKKFCRSLKRSLWYGMQDIAHSLMPWNATKEDQDIEFSGELPPLRKDEFWAVRDVSFELRRGECLGLIGRNGAGKSTLLKILNSLNRPNIGQITMRGRVGALIELSAGFNPILTGRENIYNQAAVLGFSKQETDAKFDAIVEFSELENFLDMPVQNYSSGMKVRLGFAVSSQMEPDILLVDEVLAVGDVDFRFKCLNKMADLLTRCAVIFVSHSMPQVFRVATSAMVLQQGHITYYGNDVGDGIENYISLASKPEQTVSGNGAVTVSECSVTAGDQVSHLGEAISIRPELPIQLDLKINFNHSIDEARVQAVLWNQEMIPVVELVAEEGLGFIASRNRMSAAEMTATVPALHLNGGRHLLTINVVSKDYRKVYCRHDNAAILNVLNSSVSGANCIVNAKWCQK